MKKDRFLDVNGFNAEYDIPLEKRLNKYRKGEWQGRRDSSRAIVADTDTLRERSLRWRAGVRRRQVVTAIAAAAIFVVIVAFAWYITFGL